MKPLRQQIRDLEKRAVARSLAKHDGCIARAARTLRLHRRSFERLVDRYNLRHMLKRHHAGPPLQGNDAWRALGA